MSAARDARHRTGQTPLVIPPREHDASYAPRYRFAGPRVVGCPLRSDYDSKGVLRLVACTDLRGTLESCKTCQRHP